MQARPVPAGLVPGTQPKGSAGLHACGACQTLCDTSTADRDTAPMSDLPVPRFDVFYRHAELTRACCTTTPTARPDLVRIESIGKSHEGRDIWLAVITQERHRSPTPTSRRSGATATSTPAS